MRFLYVMDPLASVNPHKDTTFAFLEESQARGIENLVCGLADLSVVEGRARASAEVVEVARRHSPQPADIKVRERRTLWLDDVDVVWMRKDPPVDDLYLFACMMLDHTHALVVNDPRQLRVVHEKLWGLAFAELGPRTLVSSRPAELVDFVRRCGRGVLKPLHLMGGLGVMAFQADDKNLKSAADLLTLDGKRPAIAQEFLPEVGQGDKRVILLDGEPIGAVLRVPQGDDVRSNLHVGGSAVRAEIDDRDRHIAAAIGPTLARLGQLFVGIDVIGGKLTEVNVTSPTGVQEIDRLDARTGKDRLSSLVMDKVLAHVVARRL